LRLVAYVRVSEETENPDNQKFAIYEWVARRGYVVERGSRTSGSPEPYRPGRDPGLPGC